MTELFSAAFSGASEEEIDAIGTRILAEELTNLTENDMKRRGRWNLQKWKVAKIKDNSEFLNGMFGGMIDVVKEFEKLGDSLNGDEKEEENSEVVAAESVAKEGFASEVMTQSAPSETT